MKTFSKLAAIAMMPVLLPMAAMAQKGAVTVGAHAGTGLSRLCCGSMEANKDYQFKVGPTFGLTAAYGLNNKLSLLAELNYTTQGGKKEGMQALSHSGQTVYADFSNKLYLNYLELPVMARMTFGSKIKYYANAGIFGGYLLSAKHKASGSSALYLDKDGKVPFATEPVSFDADNAITDNISNFNFGLVGGLGAGYTFGVHGVWLDGRYAYGMPNIMKNTSVNGENSTGSIMVMAGYTYTLNTARKK